MDKAEGLLIRLVAEWGEQGPVDGCEGELWCLLCGTDMAWLPVTGHSESCLWLEIVSIAANE